jgi:cell division protein FtsI/penicillin-binding protein 2
MAQRAMASYRRRGAHAAARRPSTPFVSVKRVPQLAAGGRVLRNGGVGGLVSGLRSRSRQLKLGAAGLVAAILVAGVAGGIVSGEPSAEPTAQAFLLAWAQGQYRNAAALTTGAPKAVATELRSAYQQLGAAAYYLSMGPITQHPGGTATAQFNASVDLGQDGPPWTYQGHFTLRKTSAGWRVVWGPSVINPALRPGLRLALVSRMPARAPVLDAEGASLIRSSTAFIAQVRPGKLASPAATAAALAQITGLDREQVLSVIRAAPQSERLTLLTLDPDSFRRLNRQLDRVPGLTIHEVSRRLFNSTASDVTGVVGTEIAPALQAQGISYRPGTTIGVSGLQEVYQRQLAGSAKTLVVAENQTGHQMEVLKKWDWQRGTPVRTTIDAQIQTAADHALAGEGEAAGVVAVQASTGRILAAARHTLSGVPRVDPLDGHYQPGGAFTIVSTAALLADGLSPANQIPCLPSTSVGGRTFTNVPAAPSLGGHPPFSSDFAESCGTAFTTLSQRLSSAKLSESAASFGFGARWKLPLNAFAGSFQAAGSQSGLAANTIGQQGVQASPLAMALAAAGVGSGKWHPPVLVTSPPDPGLTPHAVAAPQTVGSLRKLMRAAVTKGAAQAANLSGTSVYGQVGTAPMTPGSHWWAHWFVGYRGDVAFAVLVLSKSSSASAVPLGARFLARAG